MDREDEKYFYDYHDHSSRKMKPLDKSQFGNCKVCQDKASGIHYGVATCEGCKVFFKRNLNKRCIFKCYYGNNCHITSENRKKCKACRFKMCLNVGMSMEGIKMGRIPQIEKIKLWKTNIVDNTVSNELVYFGSNLKTSFNILCQNYENYFKRFYEGCSNAFIISNHFDAMSCITENLKKEVSAQKIIFSEYQRFSPNEPHSPKEIFNSLLVDSTKNFGCPTSGTNMLRNRILQLYIELTKPIQAYLERATYLIGSNMDCDDQNDSMEEALTGLVSEILRFVRLYVPYAKKLPGFAGICDEDFYRILDDNLPLIFAIRSTKLYINGETFYMDGETHLDRKKIIKAFGFNDSMIIFEFHRRLNELNLSDYELAWLIPYIITSSKIALNDRELVTELNNCYSLALLYELNLNRKDYGAFFKILECIDLYQPILANYYKQIRSKELD